MHEVIEWGNAVKPSGVGRMGLIGEAVSALKGTVPGKDCRMQEAGIEKNTDMKAVWD